MFENPGHFCCRKIGVQHQARLGLNRRSPTLFFQVRTHLCRPSALPDDGIAEGLSGFPVPGHHSFALIGDPDAHNFTARRWKTP